MSSAGALEIGGYPEGLTRSLSDPNKEKNPVRQQLQSHGCDQDPLNESQAVYADSSCVRGLKPVQKDNGLVNINLVHPSVTGSFYILRIAVGIVS